MNKKISFRSNFSENIVFISGLSRSGKSLFCPIVSSLNNVENFHIIPLIEEILRLNSLGYIKNDVADYLIKINFNHLIYENSIGRNFNFRPKDWTSIRNYPKANLYIKKLNLKDGDVAYKKLLKRNTLSPFMLHDGIIYSKLLLRNFKNVKILHIQRHPIDIIISWLKKNLENKKSLLNQRHLFLLFNINNKTIPYHSLRYYKKYLKLNHLERIIKTIENIIMSHKKNYQKLSKKQKKQIFFVNFDKFVTNPNKELKKICKFLKVKKTSATNLTLKKQRCPRKIELKLRKRNLFKIKKNLTYNFQKKIEKLIKEYEAQNIKI
tara:strand:+ start:4976 stop:5941 length:966 start_codon:yes stop_codon:yes gene_type:complete